MNVGLRAYKRNGKLLRANTHTVTTNLRQSNSHFPPPAADANLSAFPLMNFVIFVVVVVLLKQVGHLSVCPPDHQSSVVDASFSSVREHSTEKTRS